MMYYSFFSVFLISVVSCNDRRMVDPHDMFEIYKDSSFSNHLGDQRVDTEVFREDGNSPPEMTTSDACKVASPYCCKNFIQALLLLLNQQLPNEVVEEDYLVSLGFSLTMEDVISLKHHSNGPGNRGNLCTILLDSIQRDQMKTYYSIVISWMKYFFKALVNMFYSLQFYLYSAFRFTVKDFVVLMWFSIFISSLFVTIYFRSVMLTLSWIFLCVIFTSTYTTYHQMYEEKSAERDALLLKFGNRIPKECQNPKKSWFQASIVDLFYVGEPVEMSQTCVNFFKKMSISPELEIHLSDVFSKTIFGVFVNIIPAVMTSIDDVSNNISAKYSWVSSWQIYFFIFVMTMVLIVVVISLCFGHSVSFFGLHLYRHHPVERFPSHPRTVVEPVSPVQSEPQGGVSHVLPPATWVHDLMQLTSASTELRLQTQHSIDGSSKPNVSQQKPAYKKLKSVGALMPALQNTRENSRRLSF